MNLERKFEIFDKKTIGARLGRGGNFWLIQLFRLYKPRWLIVYPGQNYATYRCGSIGGISWLGLSHVWRAYRLRLMSVQAGYG